MNDYSFMHKEANKRAIPYVWSGYERTAIPVPSQVWTTGNNLLTFKKPCRFFSIEQCDFAIYFEDNATEAVKYYNVVAFAKLFFGVNSQLTRSDLCGSSVLSFGLGLTANGVGRSITFPIPLVLYQDAVVNWNISGESLSVAAATNIMAYITLQGWYWMT